MRRFQLMQRVNVEGLYGAVQEALPHLRRGGEGGRGGRGGRIVVVSPPIYSRFFRGKTAYAIGKVGMSVLTKGLAMDFEREQRESGGEAGASMAISSLWPAVVGLAFLFSFLATCPMLLRARGLGEEGRDERTGERTLTRNSPRPSSPPRRSSSRGGIHPTRATCASRPSSRTPCSPCSGPRRPS